MKALKALYMHSVGKLADLFFDDRAGLLLAGMMLTMAMDHFKAGDYVGVTIDLAFAVVVGGMAWRSLGRAVRS